MAYLCQEWLITVVDDNRKSTNQTRNFITNGGDNLIAAEDGDSFVSEVGEDVPVTSEIEIIGDVFPHGSHEFAKWYLQMEIRRNCQ